MSVIFKRQSIRKFKDKPVEKDKIIKLLKAGMQAPSACNQQAWEFIVVSKLEDKIAISAMHQFAKPAANASHLIITVGNLNEAKLLEWSNRILEHVMKIFYFKQLMKV